MDAAAAAAAAAVSTLSALAVFVSTVHQGAVRSAHGYKVVGRREWERWVEREFAFTPSSCREVPLPVGAPRILPTDWRGRPVYREGQLVGPWRCILAFDSVAGVAPPTTLPPLLAPGGNARLICCVPSLYNDLLKLFPFQKWEKVPEPILCDSNNKRKASVDATISKKTPLDAKDTISKKLHTQLIQCDPPLDTVSKKVQAQLIQCNADEQNAPLDTAISKKLQTEPIQCDSDDPKTPLDTKDIISNKVQTELIHCDSDEPETPLDTKDIISNKVQTEPIQSHSYEQATPLDTKDIISKKVQTEPIQSHSYEQAPPLDTKDGISIKVQTELIHCHSYEQATPLDTKDGISIKVQQSGAGPYEHPRSCEELPIPKQRRAQRDYIASLTLGDIAQYFHLPIREASKTLQIGLSILKKKCRQYGIPRWPHRKIKSLDSLIQDLEYVIDDTERDGVEQEHSQKETEKDDAIRSLAKRKRMLETEMATIQQKPTLDLMTETKQFRQFVFKRRYKAKHLVDE
uniref:Uncharacterized protein n=1 Tax=Avena sativa TaxID=4498 RepID=A0ACD5V2M5_AVESA